MQTTSATQSLWLDTAASLHLPALTEDIEVDVAVLGGGIAGLTTAPLLKPQGPPGLHLRRRARRAPEHRAGARGGPGGRPRRPARRRPRPPVPRPRRRPPRRSAPAAPRPLRQRPGRRGRRRRLSGLRAHARALG